MKSIIVDLPSGLAYPSSVLSAFKVYVKKNHFFNLTVCGDAANFSVLEDTENIECVYCDVGETSSHLALKEMVEREDVAGLLTFADQRAFYEEAAKLLPHWDVPCFGLFYSSKIEGKETLILDASGLFERKEENYLAYLEYGKDYSANVLQKPSVDIALLGFGEDPDPVLAKVDHELRINEKNYHGFLTPEHLFDGSCDLVLAGGVDGALAIGAAKGAIAASKTAQKIQASKSWTSLLGKKKDAGEDSRFDSRLDQRGYLLFGAKKNILCLNKNSGYGDVTDALPVIEHLAFKKPYQK
jgi:fatty acid/phospholipid biosynthesis enzyme